VPACRVEAVLVAHPCRKHIPGRGNGAPEGTTVYFFPTDLVEKTGPPRGSRECAGLQEALRPREGHGPGTVVRTELAEDGGEVVADGALGDKEPPRNLPVREALRYQPQHL
jgi:hypothetical protein